MKKIISFAVLILLAGVLLAGCGGHKQAEPTQKSVSVSEDSINSLDTDMNDMNNLENDLSFDDLDNLDQDLNFG